MDKNDNLAVCLLWVGSVLLGEDLDEMALPACSGEKVTAIYDYQYFCGSVYNHQSGQLLDQVSPLSFHLSMSLPHHVIKFLN